MQQVDLEANWAMVDAAAEKGYNTVAVELMKTAIFNDPEGAARRANAFPHYDQDRMDADLDRARAEAARMGGGEHEPVPDGGGDSGKPHPEGSTEPEQTEPEPQAPPEPYWPVDPSYTRPDTEPASPEDFALANDCS